MEILRMSRPYEDIYFENPMDNPSTPRFRVYFDDRSIEEMLGKVANAIDRAQSLDRKAKAAGTPDERAEVTEMMVHLQSASSSPSSARTGTRSCSNGWATERPSTRRST